MHYMKIALPDGVVGSSVAVVISLVVASVVVVLETTSVFSVVKL